MDREKQGAAFRAIDKQLHELHAALLASAEEEGDDEGDELGILYEESAEAVTGAISELDEAIESWKLVEDEYTVRRG